MLLDTLVRPYGETDEAARKTCVKWVKDPSRAVPHAVVGTAKQTGGQWAENPVKASWDIGALSYAGMLSLPGFTFEEYYWNTHGKAAPFYLRPTRRDVAGYLAEYPRMVGISDTIFSNETVSGISRHDNGFHIGSHNISCKHLILASGTFTNLIPPRPLLQPLLQLNETSKSKEPLLVVGSGFSAADIILSTPRDRKIIHIYKWAPSTNPSPLRACHQQAYPEYAGVYRKMKLAALVAQKERNGKRPSAQRTISEVDLSRDWGSSYEGLPNTFIQDVEMHNEYALVTLQPDNAPPLQRKIGAFAYVVGRRGSLEYLDEELVHEICPVGTQLHNISGATIREKVSNELEIVPGVFVTGSLTGDSLIRFAYGACAYAAGRIMADKQHQTSDEEKFVTRKILLHKWRPQNGSAMNGLDGHDVSFVTSRSNSPLDRRKSEICVKGY